MRIIFMGTPDFSVGTLRALYDAGHEIVLAVTQPDKPRGRGKHMQAPPVKVAAEALGIPVYQPKRIRQEECVRHLRTFQADVMVVIAFGQILPKEILEMTPFGCINVHASLLPAYRGAAPIQWSLIDGCSRTGVTTMQMDEGLDTGDMLLETVVPITDTDTGESLHDKLAKTGAQLCVETLRALQEGTVTPRPQPKDSPTAYARMLRKEMGDIPWDQPAAVIDRLIRGLTPWPGAYTYADGRLLKIKKAIVAKDAPVSGNSADMPAVPGTVLAARDEGIYVQTGEGVLCICRLQPEGKKEMDSASFLRGNALPAGVILHAKKAERQGETI